MSPNNPVITVLLIDDHPVVRDGFRRILENTPDIRVVAEADDGETGYALHREHKPDVVVLDLNMPGIGGLETVRRIKAHDPGTHILVFSMHANEIMVQRALEMGATGYLTKQGGLGQMVQAVRQVKLGRMYIDPEHVSCVVTNRQLHDAAINPLNELSKREFQLFKLMAEGNSVGEIAETLSISSKTVGVHHTNIMKKLKLQNATQLVRLAIHCNVIES
ncbi:MAG: response regulator transcription factor [Gallionella sp.]|nr:MAG: response regulator transcription factor [Gallionella sp.]